MKDYTNELKKYVFEKGADLAGIADLKELEGIETIPENLFDGYIRAVSIAVSLPVSIFNMITDAPTPIYSSVYQTVNNLLNEIALFTAKKLENDGYLSLPIPASQILDYDNFSAALSHKAVARTAGLGWQGKNLLIITPEYGSRVRLITVLTDAPLEADKSIKNRCGKCSLCKDMCPAGAIKGVNTTSYYKNRDAALYFDRCAKKLTEDFAEMQNIGSPLCGVCIKACPYTNRGSVKSF